MDPLSIAAGCVGLLGAIAKTTAVVIDFIRACREARTDLSGITRELSDLYLVLEFAQRG